METVLVSDFLLVQVPGEGWLPFRDVFERDGKQVRDRQERLAALFLKGSSRSAFAQARAIMDEVRATTSATWLGTSTCRRFRCRS